MINNYVLLCIAIIRASQGFKGIMYSGDSKEQVEGRQPVWTIIPETMPSKALQSNKSIITHY